MSQLTPPPSPPPMAQQQQQQQPDGEAPPALSWHNPKLAGAAPSPRRGHACANLDDQWLLCFGGSGLSGVLGDLHALKIDIEVPTWVPVTDTHGTAPPPVTGHSATVLLTKAPRVRADFCVFGGKTAEGVELNDLYALDVVEKEWRVVETHGSPPPPRYGHTATLAGSMMIVFGGRSRNGFLNDVCVLNTDTYEWRQQDTTGIAPCPRYAHTAVASLRTGKLYVFGGSNGNETFNSLFALDLNTWAWEELYVTGLPPDSRAYHAASLFRDQFLIIHGGSNGGNCFSDACILDINTMRWHRAAVSGGRWNIFQQTMTPSIRGDKLYVLGGHTGQTVVNEMRMLFVSGAVSTLSPTVASNVNPDAIITYMKSVIGKTPGERCLPREEDLLALCVAVRQVVLNEPSLMEVDVPAQLFGDIHGQYYDLLKLFENFGWPSDDKSFVFIGDFVDRGKQSLEVITLLFALKLRFPTKVVLLRGNHEDERINCLHGFLDECLQAYNYNVWKAINDCFACLPIACIVGERIFCVHGGISPRLGFVKQVKDIHKPTPVMTDSLLEDILWADPTEETDMRGFVHRTRGMKRGCSFDFGPDVVEHFVRSNDLDLVVRAHEVVQDGFELFADGRLVTLFSAPNYCGEYDNAAAIMCIDAQYVIDFKVLQPVREGPSPMAPSAKASDDDLPKTRIRRMDSFLGVAWDPSEHEEKRCISPPRNAAQYGITATANAPSRLTFSSDAAAAAAAANAPPGPSAPQQRASNYQNAVNPPPAHAHAAVHPTQHQH